MLIQKPNPTGIDLRIQWAQQVAYERLVALWDLDDNAWTCYERAYKNQQESDYVPEVFIPAANGPGEYKEVYWDDKLTALSFFGVGDQETIVRDVNTAKVFIIFMVDLSRLKPGAFRNDAEVHRDVQEQFTLFNFAPTGLITGINNVFQDYGGYRRNENEIYSKLKFRDMHPMHCFRINFDVLYNILDVY